MSVARFQRQVASLRLSTGDQKWMPKWLAMYAGFVRGPQQQDLPVDACADFGEVGPHS